MVVFLAVAADAGRSSSRARTEGGLYGLGGPPFSPSFTDRLLFCVGGVGDDKQIANFDILAFAPGRSFWKVRGSTFTGFSAVDGLAVSAGGAAVAADGSAVALSAAAAFLYRLLFRLC